MRLSSARDNARSNEPCACEKDIPDGCLHPGWDVFFCKHTANAATTRDAKHSESVGMAENTYSATARHEIARRAEYSNKSNQVGRSVKTPLFSVVALCLVKYNKNVLVFYILRRNYY